MEDPIRVLLVDDQPGVRRGLSMRLGLEHDLQVVGEAADGHTAVVLTKLLRPDVVLMDIEMPVLDGIAATAELTEQAPTSAVVILSIHDGPDMRRRAREAGAAAFVAKHMMDCNLTSAIRDAARAGGT